MIIKIPALYWIFVGQVPSSASELHTWTCCVVKLVDRRASVNRKNCEESTMYLFRAELIIALHIKPFLPFWLRRSLIYFQFGFHSSLSMSSSSSSSSMLPLCVFGCPEDLWHVPRLVPTDLHLLHCVPLTVNWSKKYEDYIFKKNDSGIMEQSEDERYICWNY